MPEIVTITMNPAIDTSTEADRVVPEHKLRCAAPKRDPGGGGINVARVASRLGADVLAGPRLSEAEQRKCLEALGSCGRPAYMVASGSLPPGVPDDFYASAARTAKSAGARFVLDTSGPPLKAALEEGVHLVKPNLRELSDMVGE